MKQRLISQVFLLSILLFTGCSKQNSSFEISSIDRKSVVERNNVILNAVDTLGSLSVGNGEFAFTVDVSGLQSFPEVYEKGISLGTQSQWGWHSIPNPDNYAIDVVTEIFESCNDKMVPYAVQPREGRGKKASDWLRANPHRLHLGIVGLVFLDEDGNELGIDALTGIDQKLDLWTGKIQSKYQINGEPVTVELYGHQEKDGIAAKITSPLLAKGQVKLKLRFPYGAECHVCPGYDWGSPEKHQTLVSGEGNTRHIKRILDDDTYFVNLEWEQDATITDKSTHYYWVEPQTSAEDFTFSIEFANEENGEPVDNYQITEASSTNGWQTYWNSGGFIDFGECTDSRAKELERRVILSQYLTKIQCSGSMPPQETGLTMNSWYGKFHLEMHWWHGVHFPLWGKANLLENSMDWYYRVMEAARETALWQGYEGVRWQKMTGPNGRKSPSSVGEFLAWQQPHPIYMAELLYRSNPTKATLKKYSKMVFETATFMASYAQKTQDGYYHLCHPLIPAQELFHATETNDPPFEVTYWYWALKTALAWQERMGIEKNEKWLEVTEKLVDLPRENNLYLPAAGAEGYYETIDRKRDHPVVVGSLGMLPATPKVDPAIMTNTFDRILKEWQWETTWGWDYPMMAMTAARLGKPDEAINSLFMPMKKNTYLINGHNYQDDRLRLYLPGNGGLLIAVGMMAAGWDGSETYAPGFPKDGTWNIKWEGLNKMP
ncbi:MAG: hypothetical protein ACFHWX_14900 [Bacteroidota bacterium]